MRSKRRRTLLDMAADTLPTTATALGTERCRAAMAQVPVPMSRCRRQCYVRGYARGLASGRLVPGRQTPAYIVGWHEGVWMANDISAVRKRGWAAI